MATDRRESDSARAGIARPVGVVLLALIKVYRRLISPLLAPSCRFTPSCSEYAELAVRAWGPWKGSWLAVRRVCRCHPFHEGGVDPVPTRLSTKAS